MASLDPITSSLLSVYGCRGEDLMSMIYSARGWSGWHRIVCLNSCSILDLPFSQEVERRLNH